MNLSLNSNIGQQSSNFESGLGPRLENGEKFFEVMLLDPQSQNPGNTPHPMFGIAGIEIIGDIQLSGRGANRRASITIKFRPPEEFSGEGHTVVVTDEPDTLVVRTAVAI